MPPPPVAMGGQPSMFDKFKMGAIMGTTVGLSMGFIFGGFTVLRGGAGPKGPLHTMSQYMLSSAATFGFFMSIGSVIRSDSSPTSISQALREDKLVRLRIASREEGREWLRKRDAAAPVAGRSSL
ncbi:reactive mitochondrial oxygen species modulator 1-domain-containing protein [Mrakia frigida]|uniref:Mgr2p n=1 Tax=Mrakia frigida TaxID=29902 RepID=UPI003FCC1C6B